MNEPITSDTVVITGMGLCTPFGRGRGLFADGLRAGRDCSAPIERFSTDELRSHRACLIGEDEVQALDSKKRRLPRAHQFAWLAVEEAIADSGAKLDSLDRDRVGVFAAPPGNTEQAESYHETLVRKGPRLVSPLQFEATTFMAAAGTVSIELNITGPSMALPGGFSSGLQALHAASSFLRRGRLDVALVFAADEVAPLYYHSLAHLGLLSPRRPGEEERCRPFDKGRNGMVLGEGAVAFVLETHSHSEIRDAAVHARLASSAVAHDGYRAADVAPDGRGLARALEQALARGGIGPEDIDLIVGCANGLPWLDRAEASALAGSFGASLGAVPVTSIKSMAGEAGAASGLAGVAACVIAIEEDLLPPTINYSCPDEGCLVEVVANAARPKRVGAALANAYSFGGSSGCALIEREGTWADTRSPETSRR